MRLSVWFITIFSLFKHTDSFRYQLHYNSNIIKSASKKYPLSQLYYENYIKRLNSKNITIRNYEILNEQKDFEDEDAQFEDDLFSQLQSNKSASSNRLIIRLNRQQVADLNNAFNFIPNTPYNDDDDPTEDEDDEDDSYFSYKKSSNNKHSPNKKSKNFNVITDSPYSFKDVGGYDSIKSELYQCIGLLKNFTKYSQYNVRIPKGLILEGPPGNGKTLLAKALAGEAGTAFITVSGSEFQEVYVGVGSSRIRELFELAKKNIPCIIFIDEIDALGRARAKDGEASSSERDNTLNELLVALDGFKTSTGIFVIGATNRADLLDIALTRPGRIDKRIYIGNPDKNTREAIIRINLNGKPSDSTVDIDTIVEITAGFSCAQIENLLNEAMLNALRLGNTVFSSNDLDTVYNRIMAGWQPNEHQFTNDIIDHIAIHELGHALIGLVCKHHAKVTKVVINLSSPKSPAYTIFESATSNIYTREALFEHLMILLSGRIAEEAFYGVSVTTGAINDFEEALKLAEKMILYYGLGEKIIYPVNSEKYKEMVDNEISNLIQDAYGYAELIIHNSKDFINEGAELLKEQKVVQSEQLSKILKEKYPHVYQLKMMNQ
jgi:cell division protease FtsH